MTISEILNRLSRLFAALFVLVTVLPVKLNYSSMAIISLTLLALFRLIYFREAHRLPKAFLAAMTIPFAVYMLGLINSSNVEVGLDYVTRNASFLAFPIIFGALGDNLLKRRLMPVFLTGLAITNTYLIYLFIYYFNFGERFYMVVTEDIYHATYLGMYNLVAYWVCISKYREGKHKVQLALSAFFLMAAVMTSTRIVFLLAVISLGTTVFIIAGSLRQRLGLLVLFGIFASVVVTQIPSVRQKFDQFREIRKIGFDRKNYESISSRFGKIEASVRLLKRNPLFGTGTGDLMDELREEYREMKFTMGYKYGYNPHNQYLDNLARNGIIGGGLALACIYLLPLYLGVRKGDLLMGAFIGVVGGVSLTESVLDVHKGITFYVFFATMLIHESRNE